MGSWANDRRQIKFGALIAVPTIACMNVAGTYLTRRHEGPRPPEPETHRAKVPVAVG